MKIMLVDDEESMQTLVGHIITAEGYDFCSARDGEEALKLLERENPDLIILDVMMPKMNGFQACRRIREKGVISPIIFLSAKSDIVDKCEGFEAGGNDYLIKPFDPQELCLRVKAHLRQFASMFQAQKTFVRTGPLEIDVKRHRVSLRGERVDLTAKEFQILFLLASCPGEVFTREQLVEEAWGAEFIGATSSLAVFIRKIREKIEENPSCPRLIQTVRNIGYKLEDSDQSGA